MSVFGGPSTNVNIYGNSTSSSTFDEKVDNTKLLLDLFDMIEIIEDTVFTLILPKDEFGIAPEAGFKSITVQGNYPSLLARKLYYKNGFPTLPNGTCDCRILERLYKEHPVLRLYSFESAEPQCCS